MYKMPNLEQHFLRLRLLKPYWLRLICAMVIMVITSASQLIIPKGIATFFDAPQTINFDAKLITFIILLIIFLSFLTALRFYIFEKIGIDLVTSFRRNIHKTLLYKPVSFYESINISEVTSRLTSDSEQLKDTLTLNLAQFIRASLIFFGSLVSMIFISPSLCLVIVLIFPFFLLISQFLAVRFNSLSENVQHDLAESSKVAFDNLNCFPVIKVYNGYNTAEQLYQSSTEKYATQKRKLALLISGVQGVLFSVMYLSLAIVLILGVWQIQNKYLTVGELSAFALYLAMVFTCINTLADFFADWMQCIGATNYLFSLDADIHKQALNNNAVNSQRLESLKLCNISFSYPSRPETKVFENFTFEIVKGETLVLKGPSGAGKSTLLKVLMGFYPPTKGKLLFNNKSLSCDGYRLLRELISYVEQEPLLFSTSIYQNLSLVVADKPDEQVDKLIIEACKKANVHDFIMSLPEQYDTQVGDRGTQLSGGQKQRLAIARALLKQSEILILDEYTSALDKDNRDNLQQIVNENFSDKTVIIVSHNETDDIEQHRVVYL